MYSRKHLDTLFVNLKILGKITTQGRKLYTHDNYLKLDNGDNYKQKVYRWIYNENRAITLEKIKEVIRESIDIGQSAMYSEILLRSSHLDGGESEEIKKWVDGNIQILGGLLSEMKKAINGIKTLQDTYSDDSTLCSKLELEIELLENAIIKFEKFLLIN